MVNKYEVDGFDSYIEKITNLSKLGKPTVILFSGSNNPETGKSWCSDCVSASHVINSVLSKFSSEDINFLYVNVGNRTFWKDPSNVFRTDARTRIKSIPTLMKYGTPQRIEESQCANPELVQMIFDD